MFYSFKFSSIIFLLQLEIKYFIKIDNIPANIPFNVTNPYDFEIDTLLYIDPVSKYIYANSSAKGSIKDCADIDCNSTQNKTSIIDQILSYSDNNRDFDDNSEEISEVCKYGQLQSPINIVENTSLLTSDQFNIFFDIDMSTIDWKIFYTKHNFGIEIINSCSNPHIQLNSSKYGINEKKYCLSNIHIHLSCDKDTFGSEHAIQYEKFNAEIHLVFVQNNDQIQLLQQNELVIYQAILLRATNNFNNITPLDKFLQNFIINYEKDYNEVDTKNLLTDIELKELSEILNPTKKPIYIYHGSLTSAPCTENVLWIVVKYPAIISYETLNALKNYRINYYNNLFNKEYANITNTNNNAPSTSAISDEVMKKCSNFRPLQNKIKHQIYSVNEMLEENQKFKLLNIPYK